MRRFYLYRHKNGMIYAEIMNEQTGARLASRSTGTKDRDEALLQVAGWLRDGIPSREKGRKPRTAAALRTEAEIMAGIEALDGEAARRIAAALRERGLIDFSVVKPGPGNVDFLKFITDFWDFDTSPYVREKLAHKQQIGRKHCYNMKNCVRLYWTEKFQGKKLRDIDRAGLKEFGLGLAEAGMASNTLVHIMQAGTIPVGWAFREGLISVNPAEKLRRFSGPARKRGVFTPEEAAELFAVTWPDKRTYAGNILAATSGLRQGEITALRQSDIEGETALNIRHSWAREMGLKSTKTGECRRVPVLPQVMNLLRDLIRENPWVQAGAVDDPFIFYHTGGPDRPIHERDFSYALKAAVETVNAGRKRADPDAELINLKDRNIVFHSWRHYFAARMVDKMSPDQIVRVTGHKTRTVFDHYADHIEEKNLDEMRDAAGTVFGNIIDFSKAKEA
jgi:integrase